jgi:hypothetical protein
MKSIHDSKNDHALRLPLEEALRRATSGSIDIKTIVEEVLLTLDEQNLIAYADRNTVNILTPFGKVLCLLIESPNLTVREMSVFIGVSEAQIVKAIAKLTTDNLLARTKVNGRFEYSVNLKEAKKHSDIRRLVLLLSAPAE